MLKSVVFVLVCLQSTSQLFVSSQQQGSLPAPDGLPIASTGNGLASQSHAGCESLIAVEARQRVELKALEEALVTNVAMESKDSGRHGKTKRRHHAYECYDGDEDSCDDSSDDCDDSSDDSDDSCDDSSDDSCDDSSEDYHRHRRHKKHKKHRHHHKKHKKHKKKKDEKSTSNVFSKIRGVNIGTTFTNIQITGGNATAPEQPSSATPTTNFDLIRNGGPGWGGLGGGWGPGVVGGPDFTGTVSSGGGPGVPPGSSTQVGPGGLPTGVAATSNATNASSSEAPAAAVTTTEAPASVTPEPLASSNAPAASNGSRSGPSDPLGDPKDPPGDPKNPPTVAPTRSAHSFRPGAKTRRRHRV